MLSGRRSSIATEPLTTASEKVALTGVPTATPLEPGAGTRATTVGAVVSFGAACRRRRRPSSCWTGRCWSGSRWPRTGRPRCRRRCRCAARSADHGWWRPRRSSRWLHRIPADRCVVGRDVRGVCGDWHRCAEGGLLPAGRADSPVKVTVPSLVPRDVPQRADVGSGVAGALVEPDAGDVSPPGWRGT